MSNLIYIEPNHSNFGNFLLNSIEIEIEMKMQLVGEQEYSLYWIMFYKDMHLFDNYILQRRNSIMVAHIFGYIYTLGFVWDAQLSLEFLCSVCIFYWFCTRFILILFSFLSGDLDWFLLAKLNWSQNWTKQKQRCLYSHSFESMNLYVQKKKERRKWQLLFHWSVRTDTCDQPD